MEDNATPGSLPADGNPESSTGTEAAAPSAHVETPTQKVEQEKPFHEHPRWKEIQQEKELLRQQNQQLLDLVQRQQVPQQPVNPQDPISEIFPNATPEERVAIENLRKLSRKEAEGVATQRETTYKKQMEEQQRMLMAVIYQNFQARHPEVETGSQEEKEMLQLFSQGVPLDTAYKAVYAPINAQREVEKVRQQHTVKQQQKIQANLETSTVSPNNGIPQKQKMSFREILVQEGKKGGYAGF